MRNTERAAGDGEERWRLGCFLVLVTLHGKGMAVDGGGGEGRADFGSDIFVVV